MSNKQHCDFSFFYSDGVSPFETTATDYSYHDSVSNIIASSEGNITPLASANPYANFNYTSTQYDYSKTLSQNVCNYPQTFSNTNMCNYNTVADKKGISPQAQQIKLSQHDIMRQFISIIPVRTRKNKIYIYNGRFYELSSDLEIKRKILYYFRNYFTKGSASQISGVLDFILIEPDIILRDEEIRMDLLSFNNGVLNLKTREFYIHNPAFVTTYSINADYTSHFITDTPVFDSFINHITGGDSILAERIWQILGYCMTPDTSAKAIFLFQGVGDSGKSILTKLLQNLFSKDSIFPFEYSKLNDQFALSDWFGKTLCTCNDMPNSPINEKAVSTLKALSGNDTVSSPEKHKKSIVFDNTSKILLVSNHSIISKTYDKPFYNRLITVPFEFPATEKNPNLINELLLERNSIVTKAIWAYWRLVDNNYIFPGNYQPNDVIDLNNNDNLAISIYNFVKYSFETDSESYVFTDEAYEAYLEKNIFFSKNQFYQYFKKFAHEIYGAIEGRKRKDGAVNPTHCVKGIKFRSI